MLEDCYRRTLELADQVCSRGNIENIVVAQLFALELVEMLHEGSVECRLLVWVFPVTQGHRLLGIDCKNFWKA